METFDVVVIGAGPGGYPAAIRAAQLGATVALIEEEELGGTCLNWGCIPTKTLVAGVERYHMASHSDIFGISVERIRADYSALIRRKDEVVSVLRRGVEHLVQANGIRLFRGRASFLSRNQIRVAQPTGTLVISARATIIATGATTIMPPSFPKSERILDSRSFLDLQTLPPNLLVLGGGVIGCEFACMAAKLGSQVTIVELLEDILIVLDSDIRRELRRSMERELGIRILTGHSLAETRVTEEGLSARSGEAELRADMLLVSIGRRPRSGDLALEQAGVRTDEKGGIVIDEYCRTTASGVYAVGDVTAGSPQLAHAATSQGITAAENATGKMRRKVETVVPNCIFTSPEVGAVGISEKKAHAEGREIVTGKFPFTALGRARAMGDTRGFVKLVADAATGQLLGAQAIGPHATDLIAEAALAIRAELTLEELARTIHCHPTLSEVWMEAAHAAQGKAIHLPPQPRCPPRPEPPTTSA
ncbi:MAG: dihydrolipoyl dehydrogenase [Kiritimatiellia bacterium]